jgi:hypothetical protein
LLLPDRVCVLEHDEYNRPNTQQLKRAAAIKEKLDALNRKLRSLLAGSSSNAAPSGKKRTMSAAQRRKIAAAQRARWAKLQRAKAST